MRLLVTLPPVLAMLSGALALGGCATHSQILPVTPRPAVTANESRGAGRSMAIEVVDARGTNVVGLREPGAADTAITTPPEMLRNIQRAVEDGYRALGFELVPVGENADVVLEVRLTELGYEREAEGVVRNLRTGATFQVTSIMPDKTVDATYRDAQGKETLVKPSLATNAEILNKHIDAALAKMIADPRLTTN